MYLKRSIDRELLAWKSAKNRKPLILRGARQVGKTSSAKNLAKHFKYFIEINFDENQDFVLAFEKSNSVIELCEQISVLTNTPIVSGETLLFLDEIQASIPAIKMLRYFYEKLPDLHVIAAGSLLEFALSELPSFGVGRVRSIFMYPLSFSEFLMAQNEQILIDYLNKASTTSELPESVHKKLISLYKKFLIVGGMPEAVRVFVEKKDLLEVQRILDDLIISLQADFSKYKSRVPSSRIAEVFKAITQQVATKFSFSYTNLSLNYKQIREAIELLKMAGLVYGVTHSSANGIPLGAEINTKKIKYLIFDTGIFQRILGLNIAELLISEDFNAVNKGNIAELHVGLELMKIESCYQKTELYYWHREAKNSQAELDYVFQINESIVPIEVKAGTKGSMQSLFLFLKEKKLNCGVRFSLENFARMEQVSVIPVYAVNRLKDVFNRSNL